MKLLLVLLAAVPTAVVHALQSPFVMMPFSFSTPAAAALFLTLLVSDIANSNKGRILVQALPDFEEVGNGACEDDQNRFYDMISFQDGSGGAVVESKDDCERLCVSCACEVSVSNTNRVFRGFDYSVPPPGVGPSYCTCYFDDDPSADFTKNECKNMNAGKDSLESAFTYYSGFRGSGPIGGANADGNPYRECSKVTTSSAAKASKRPRGTKGCKTPKTSSSLQVQQMKSGASPSLSSLTAVGVCGTFAVITFMFIDLI